MTVISSAARQNNSPFGNLYAALTSTMQDSSRREALASDWTDDSSISQPETGTAPFDVSTIPLSHAFTGAVYCWAMDGFSPQRVSGGPPQDWPSDAMCVSSILSPPSPITSPPCSFIFAVYTNLWSVCYWAGPAARTDVIAAAALKSLALAGAPNTHFCTPFIAR